MRKIIFLILGIVFLLAIGGYFYLYQGHRDIMTEKASFQLSSENLISDFQKDMVAANTKYLNKTIEVKGKIKELTDSAITLEPGVFCSFNHKLTKELKDKEVTVKGRCIGYDELFNEVKLDQCSIAD